MIYKTLLFSFLAFSTSLALAERPNAFLTIEDNTVTTEVWEIEARQIFDALSVTPIQSTEDLDGYSDGIHIMITDEKSSHGIKCFRYTRKYPDGTLEPQGDRCLIKTSIK